MGSGIAAHCANAGIPVVLLDIVPPKLSEKERASKAARDGFATGALAKTLKAKPAAFITYLTALSSCFTRSVLSHVKKLSEFFPDPVFSGSRPKWPYAAVLV